MWIRATTRAVAVTVRRVEPRAAGPFCVGCPLPGMVAGPLWQVRLRDGSHLALSEGQFHALFELVEGPSGGAVVAG